MMHTTRRRFLGHLGGSAALLASAPFGAVLGRRDEGDPLAFGELEGLVELMHATPVDELLPKLVAELERGVPLARLVGAGALANARAFGGHDYTGYHVQMALQPSFAMAGELSGKRAALPVLKVLHRNARRLHDLGRPVKLREVARESGAVAPGDLRAAMEARDLPRAERALSALAQRSPGLAYHGVLDALCDSIDVHRVVLTWRSWDMLQLVGEEHAETLLRQPLRFFHDRESRRVRDGKGVPEMRALLPELLEREELADGNPGTRRATDAQLEEWARVVFGSGRADAARAAAGWLGDGYAHEDVAEALTLAATTLLLNDPGRRSADGPEKPAGSVHGASVGVHACDSARAWRNIAGVSSPRDSAACLVMGAYHTAGQSSRVGADTFPFVEEREELAGTKPHALLERLRAAVEAGDQRRACAAAELYGEHGGDPAPAFALLLETAVVADGALHAEKYYRTTREDFASSRPAHRGRHLVALARVSASERFLAAPGVDEARELLGV